MRIIIAILMVLHGVAHLVGFLGSWRLSAKIAYKTTLFADHLDVGATGIRVVGIGWLVAALGLAAAGVAAGISTDRWASIAFVAIAFSTALCVAALPETKIGLVVNVVLVALLLWGRGHAWW